MAAITVGAAPAMAEPPTTPEQFGSQANGSETVEAVINPETQSPLTTQDAVACKAHISNPYRLTSTGKTVYADGDINWCTPTPPDDCRLEAEIMRWDKSLQDYITVASGPAKNGCKLGTKSQAKYKCTPIKGSIAYKARVWLTVQYHGQTNVAHSDTSAVGIGCD
ncbi:hypothetical protein [Nonomuraea roseoviolacea]|uniref:Uncharacterized protein n=1 Tax=Nonomuraea roseoviolacea subsp. carminata TaxID=160689 RepID=A0ABT1K191_9ACTN|nr:hypothetical protein [Nonomuraea roseoviolacea]MCP2347753.1 hypothetical protein [Nonomuraea roseoviolacea subsp. carminata]